MKLTTRHLIRGKGQHRATAVLTEAQLEELLSTGEAVANESAPCPECVRTTFHEMYRDGSRRCWTCATLTPAGAQ